MSGADSPRLDELSSVTGFFLLSAACSLAGCNGESEPGGAVLPEDAPRMTGVVDLRIGQLEGDVPYLFGEITDLALDTAGRIYVADRQASEIRVFDSSGRYLFTAGREGEGPGEFSGSRGAYEPCAITVDRRGRIWAVAGDRVEVFEVRQGEGEHRTTISLDPHLDCESPMRIDSTAVTVVHTSIDTVEGTRTTSHLRVDTAGSELTRLELPEKLPLDSLGYEPVIWRRDGRVSRLPAPPPFPTWHLTAHGPHGGYASTVTSRFRVALFNRQGRRVTEIQRSVQGPPLTRDESDSVSSRLDSLERHWSGFANSWPEYEIPKRKNPIRNIWFDAEGRLWVQVWTHASRGENEAHVYSGDGELRFTVTWPVEIDLDYGASRGRVALGTTQDEMGVQRVVRLRLR